MATPNIVPRAAGEGGLGTAAKGWGGTFVTNTTASSATEGGKLVLAANDGAVMADNHRLGVIEFKGAEDTSSTLSIGARIEAICRDAWDGSNNGADLEFYTTNGTTESKVLTLDADKKATFAGDLTVNGDNVLFESANANDPIVTIKNTSNAANDMASLKFVKDRGAAPVIGDNLAEIYFVGEDSAQNEQEYGRILCETDVVTDGQESGVLKLGVANHDGGNGYGLIMTGGSVDGEVDVTVGLGAASVTTFAGATQINGAAGVSIIYTTTSSATEGGNLVLASDDGAVQGSGHRLGVIEFKGAEDTGNTLTTGARIEALADAAWSASENGADLVFYTTDGNATQTEQMRCTAATGVSIPKRKFTPTGTGTNGTVTGGDVVYFGGTTSMTAGAIYHYKSDGTWELADADAVATSDGLLAVALGAASDTNGMCLRGMVTIDHDPGAIGDVLFLSTTAGDCSATAPTGSADIVRVIGYQVNHASNGEIWFCPDGTYVELA